jgi:hypothetical protein
MERFGRVSGFLELNGPNIHRLENIMTMDVRTHVAFDRLNIWLESTVTRSDSFEIDAADFECPAGPPRLQYPCPTCKFLEWSASVTFTSAFPELPLPDPRYLALHATCARWLTFLVQLSISRSRSESSKIPKFWPRMVPLPTLYNLRQGRHMSPLHKLWFLHNVAHHLMKVRSLKVKLRKLLQKIVRVTLCCEDILNMSRSLRLIIVNIL